MSEVPEGYNKVQFHKDLYRSYKRRGKSDLYRQSRNWGMFSGVNGKQWSPSALAQLISESRAPHSVNFIQKHVISLAGNFIQNGFEPDFEPNIGVPNDDTLLLNDLYAVDRNRGQWKKTMRANILAGLIHRGSFEMYIDYKTDPRGSISLRSLNKDRVLYDPDWTSANINDNKHIIEFAWMAPDEIKRRYNKSSAELEDAIRDWEIAIATRTENADEENLKNGGYHIYNDSTEFLDIINHRYLVIQVKRLERGFKRELLDKKTGKKLRDMNDIDIDSMMMLRGESLKVYQNEYAKQRVTTVIPGLSNTLVLEDDALTDIQIGRYSNFTWSSLNIDGEVQGVVEVLKDLQEIYNKRESTFTHAQTTAANGVEFYEENFFVDEQEAQNYVDNKNKPGETFKVKPGAISGQRPGIMSRERDAIPNDLHISADRAFNMTPEVGYNVPPLSGGEGKSGESNALFESKKAQALVALEYMTQTLRDLDEEVGEAYFYLVKSVYSGAPRVINSKSKKGPILLNVPNDDGTIEGDVSRIRRHEVTVTASKKGETLRREILNKYTQMLGVIQNPIYRSIIEKNMINYVPNIPDSEIEEGKVASDKFIALQESRMDVELATNEAQIKQLQQPPQPPPQPGGPQPQQGSPENPGNEPVSVEGAPVVPGNTPTVDVNNVNQLR